MAAIAALFTAWHVFASFLWIAPPTPLRDLVPGNALHNYMIPWFGQSWSVFAPEPINGDYTFAFRAMLIGPDGEETTTDWVSATAVETSMAHHNLFPPRAAHLALKQASKLKLAYEKLTPEQREIAQLGYYKGDAWLGRMMIAMNETDDEANKASVVAYIVQERYADAYVTQAARALWGDDVAYVQYQAARQNIIPFKERNNPDAERPSAYFVSPGWRGLITLEHQSESDFADVFVQAYEGSRS